MSERFDKSAIMDQLRIVVMAYGMSAMAAALNKPYSTLANEIKEVEWAKPGLRDALAIVEISQGKRSNDQARQAGVLLLDMVEAAFGRVAYQIPEATGEDMASEMLLISQLSKEFGQTIKQIADALADRKWENQEVQDCRAQVTEMLKAVLRVDGFLKRLQDMITIR